MKTRITFEVDTNELFDKLSQMQGETGPIGERVVAAMLSDDGFRNSVGMAVYGVTVIERKPVDAAPASAAEPVAWVRSKFGDPEAFGEREIEADEKVIQKLPYNTPLYAGPDVTTKAKEDRNAVL